MAETKTKRHDGRVDIWCGVCRQYVQVQGAVDDQNTVHVTPRHLAVHRAEPAHTSALAARGAAA